MRTVARISTYAASALLGLLAYFILAGITGWMMPLWWGGEALLFPLVFGVPAVIISALLFYVFVFGPFYVLGHTYGLSYKKRTFIAVFQGFIFFPCVDGVSQLKDLLFPWGSLNLSTQVFLGLTIAAVLNIALAGLSYFFLKTR